MPDSSSIPIGGGQAELMFRQRPPFCSGAVPDSAAVVRFGKGSDMRNAFTLVVVTIAASVLVSSCAPPEPTPRNVLTGMTKEQVLKKFGPPDVLGSGNYDVEGMKKEWEERWKQDMHGLDAEMPDFQPPIIPERFLYYNEDGTLFTYIEFSEDGEVTKVERRPVKDGK